MDGSFKLMMKDCFLTNRDIIVYGKGIEAQIKGSPEKEYDVLMRTEKRLPRKRKKWLKKYGGWEYYIQVPPKNVGKATEDDFQKVINSLLNQ